MIQEMALKTASSGCFESGNDEFSNTNIAERFRTLYSNDWAKLFRLLSKSMGKEVDEITQLRRLSTTIKLIYDKCRWLHLEEKEQFPDLSIEAPVQRQGFSQREDVRIKVKEKVLETVRSTTEVMELQNVKNKENIKEKLYDFLGKVTDCCWEIVAVSNPPMILNFDVVGKPFVTVHKYWTQYSTKKPVCDMAQLEGTILLVVWPSVELKNEPKCYNKGDVVVVKIGKGFRKDSAGELEKPVEACEVHRL